MKALGATLVLGAAVATPAVACQSNGAFGFLGNDATYRMIVAPGEACSHTFTLRGGADRLDQIVIVQRARLGMAGRSGPSAIAYKAPAKPGEDRFVIEIVGVYRNAPARSRLTFDVTISP